MQTTSSLYKSILQKLHNKEVRLLIAGKEYMGESIISLATNGGIYPGLSIGNAASRQIDLKIIPHGVIPRQSKIEVFVRLTDGENVSEWIRKGVYFFSTRETDKVTGVMTVHGFDAMLKAEETWLTPDYDTENWPMDASQAVDDIARRMGVNVDSRTSVDSAFPVQYPVGEDGDLTMREVLRRIAVANAGNWIITDAGELLLLPLDSIPAETNYLVNEFGDAITFGSTLILV